MENWEKAISKMKFRYLDHTTKKTFDKEPYSALTSFAIDDALTLSVSDKLSPPTLRLWAHPKTVVLGIPDARLPYIDEGVKFLSTNGYRVIVRNSGGLAVALDDGVLNMSLILPDIKQMPIHDSYELMFHFLKHILQPITTNIKAYEIVGSYCPGDYDLSINGIKFAGISQRRIKNGAAIQIYIDIEGNSNERAKLIKKFYAISLRNEETSFSYPTVEPHVMGSLSELVQKRVTMEKIKALVYATLSELNEQIISTPFSQKEMSTFENRLKQMKKRNEPIANIQSRN